MVVTPNGGEPVAMGKGDMATFPTEMSTSKVNQAVKHSKFG